MKIEKIFVNIKISLDNLFYKMYNLKTIKMDLCVLRYFLLG